MSCKETGHRESKLVPFSKTLKRKNDQNSASRIEAILLVLLSNKIRVGVF